MPNGESSSNTVGGVVPSIKVKFVGDTSNQSTDPSTVLVLATFDNGEPREITKGGNVVLVTPDEYSKLGRFSVQVVSDASVAGEPDQSSLASQSSQRPAIGSTPQSAQLGV